MKFFVNATSLFDKISMRKWYSMYCGALLSHFVLTVFSIFIVANGYGFGGSCSFLRCYSVFHIVLIICLYIVSGYILTNQEKHVPLWSYFSVASIGFLLWSLCFIASPDDLDWKNGNGGMWLYYRLYISGIEIPLNFNDIVVLGKYTSSTEFLLILSLIPSFLQVIGGIVKKKVNKIKDNG